VGVERQPPELAGSAGPNMLGQRVMVDDGSRPASQIKEVHGSQMTTSGVVRTANACRGRDRRRA